MTYRDLDEFSDAVGRGMTAHGVARGDRVAIWLPNRPEWIGILLACAKRGVVVVPVNTWFRTRELDFVLQKSGSRMIFTQERFLGQDFGAMLTGSDRGALTVVCIEGRIDSAIDVAELLIEDADEVVQEVDPGAEFLMSFTSGTTSFPKGAMVSQAGLATNAWAFTRRLEVEAQTSIYCPVPFFHLAGLNFGVLSAFAVVGTVVANGRFTGPDAWQAIEEFGCTHTGGYEAIYHSLLDASPDGAVRTLRTVWWGGGPPALFERVERSFGATVMNAYGLTEASGNVTATPLDWSLQKRATSEGTGVNGATIEIVDPDGQLLGPDEVGEICVRSPTLMLGYYSDEEATARALRPDGRLWTGDSGFLDTGGSLHFRGRSKDMIKVGGENVAPSDLEAVLLEEFSEVVEAAVLGIPDERYGEVPIAFVRLRAELTIETMQTHLRGIIASFKIPRRLVVVDEFPRSSTGKIMKAELRRSLDDDQERPVSLAVGDHDG